MKLNETKITRPIPVFSMSVSSTQPRKSSCIEQVVVSIIARLGNSPVQDSTVLDVMEQFLGWPTMGVFLEEAMNELCSPLVNGLTMNDHENSPMDSPLNNFRLTENGRHILETGVIPAVGHQQDWKMPYDTIEKKFLEVQNLLPGPSAYPHLEIVESGFPENEIRQNLNHVKEYAEANAVIGEIQPNGVEWQWKTETITAELKNGKVTLQGQTQAFTKFLNKLGTEVVADLFAWSSQTEEPVIADLEKLKVDQVTPVSKFPSIKRNARIVLRSEANQNVPFQPGILEILYSNSATVPYLEPAQNEGPAKLHISALKDWNEESASDLKTVLSPVTARLYVNELPILADFIVEASLSNEEQSRLKDQIIAELLRIEMTESIGPAEICACILLLDSKNEAAVDFLMRQDDLEPVLEVLQKYAEKVGLETEPVLNRLQERFAQPSNLEEAINLYRQASRLNFPNPENLFRDRIAEEIVRSIWNRPQVREQLTEIPETASLCQLSTLLDDLQKQLGVPMLKPSIKLPQDVALVEFSSRCEKWLALYQKTAKEFSTQESFCEDLRQSVQNLQTKAKERIKAETEIQNNIRKELPASETSQTRTHTQKSSTEMRTSDHSRFTNQTMPQQTTLSSRTVFVLDTKALVEFPEILSFRNPAFLLVVPTCVEKKLNHWLPSAPWQEEHIESAFDYLHSNQTIQVVDHQELSAIDSILAAVADFTHEEVFLVTTNRQLWDLAKERSFQILYPSRCLKMLEEAASEPKRNFHNHNHFRKGA